MGAINDFMVTVKDLMNSGDDAVDDAIKRKKFSSISSRALDGTLQFPTIVSRSLDIDTLQMVTKALERQFSSFTQVALSMSPFLDLERDKDPAGYIRRFHQNMRKSSVKDEFFDVLSYVEESYDVYASGDMAMFATTGEGLTNGVVRSNREGLVDVMEGLCLDSINDLYVPPAIHHAFTDLRLAAKHRPTPVLEAGAGRTDPRETPLTPDQQWHTDGGGDGWGAGEFIPSNQRGNGGSNGGGGKNGGGKKGGGKNGGGKKGDSKPHVHKVKVDVTGGTNINVRGGGGDGGGGTNHNNQYVEHKLPTKVLQDNDVKKSNELIPTTMHVRTTLLNYNNENQGTLDFIAGVKATMHPVTSEDMVENMYNALQRHGAFFKFIRWTTGEIAFAKDYLMNLTEIKEDASRTSNKESRWWTALKRRKKLAKFRNVLFLPGNLLPNASVVMSIEEAEYVRREYGFDLLDPRIAYKVMNEYFLISITVVDPGAQMAHFLFDGNEDYQTVTFTGLERADTHGDGNFKDILKLVQRI